MWASSFVKKCLNWNDPFDIFEERLDRGGYVEILIVIKLDFMQFIKYCVAPLRIPFVDNKEDKINEGEHRSKNATPTTFKNRNK